MKEHNYAFQNADTRPRLQRRTQNICFLSTPPPGRDIAGHLRGIFRYLTSERSARIGDFDLFARHPRTAGKWTGVFSTEVDWVKNR